MTSHSGRPDHGVTTEAHGHDHAHPHTASAPAAEHRRDEHGHVDDGQGHDDHGHDQPHDDHGRDHAHGGIRGFLTGLLRPHSHDAADSIDSALESSALGIRAIKVSLVALLLTALAQVVVVVISGSVALLADTIHNFSDALTSIPLWIAFVIGRRAANRRYTYGYRRAEDIAGLFIVAMIAFSALLAGWESINRLLDPAPITNIGLVMVAGVVGFLGNEAVALYRIRIGRRIGSAALVADGYHARTDGLTSLAVVLGALGVLAGFPQADPLVGLLITVMIMGVLWGAAKQIFGRLMDAVDPTLVDRIEAVAAPVAGVQAVEGVRVRWIGHRLEASLLITVDRELTVAEGHDIAELVRHDLFHSVGGLDEILVHVDPCDHAGADPHKDARHHSVTLGSGPRPAPVSLRDAAGTSSG